MNTNIRIYTFNAGVWRYPGDAGWHFVTLPQPLGKEIRDVHGIQRRGFGSIRVLVRMDELLWSTSIFPDTQSGSYLLPLKKEIRRKAGLHEGQKVNMSLEIAE